MPRSSGRPAVRVVSSGEAELLGVTIIDVKGHVCESVISGDPIRICIRFRLDSKLDRPNSISERTPRIFSILRAARPLLSRIDPTSMPEYMKLRQTIPSYPVRAGTYCVRFAILDKYRRVVFHGETLHVFQVLSRASEALQDDLRTIDVPVSWAVDGRDLNAQRMCPAARIAN